jgi:hypothetical protein
MKKGAAFCRAGGRPRRHFTSTVRPAGRVEMVELAVAGEVACLAWPAFRGARVRGRAGNLLVL